MTVRQTDDGFTLVELLVTLSVISAVVTMLMITFSLITSFVNRTALQTETLNEAALLQTVLREALSQVTPGLTATAISGDERQLTARTLAPRIPPLVGSVIFSITTDNETGATTVAWQETGKSAEHMTHSLTSKNHRVHFAYFSPQKGWNNAWRDHDQLPTLVRASVRTIGPADAAITLTIPVRTVAAPQCAINAVSEKCGGRN